MSSRTRARHAIGSAPTARRRRVKQETSKRVIFAFSPPSHTGAYATPGSIRVNVGSIPDRGPTDTYKVEGETEDARLAAAFKAGMTHYSKHVTAVREHCAR